MRKKDVSSDITLASSQHVKERDYWLKKMSGSLVKMGFPYDYRENISGFARMEFPFQLPNNLFSRIMKLSHQYDYTIHVIFVAGIVLLLDKYNYNSNKDIIVGAPIYEQDIDAEFVNTVLPLRTQLKDNMSFKELLLQVKETVIEADDNQNFPIEQLVRMLDLDSDFPGKDFPLLDVAVLLENIHNKKYLGHIRLNVIFSFKRTAGGIEGVVEYNASFYKKETIERIVKHLTSLMEQALNRLDKQLASYGLLTVEERRQLLIDFNTAEPGYSRYKTIDEWFAQQVQGIPGASAVVYEDGHITYSELNERSHRLAAKLISRGIKSDDIVALMITPSLEMITGIIGIIKAGAAYFPVDPDSPLQRITYLLADSRANLLVTSTKYSETGFGIDVIDIDDDKIDRAGDPAPLPGNHPGSLAYIIYTSGSTGRPKGVMITHRGVVNLVNGLDRVIYQQYRLKLKFSLVAPYIFDASVKQIFAALLLGNCLYPVPEDIRIDGTGLIEFFNRHKIDISDGTPNLMRLILESSLAEDMNPGAQHFLIGGEALHQHTASRFFKRFKGCAPRVTNVYGPTECCVDSTYCKLNKEKMSALLLSGSDSIPIGVPMPNVQVYIMSREMMLQPVGVPGELCISGSGLARGYLNRVELTAGKFIGNPYFFASPGQQVHNTRLLYRTGDLASWHPDGNIKFLGRLDDQVKIRGFRIEPGEIENQLKNHEEIIEAVVTVQTDEMQEKNLSAYIVPGSLISISTDSSQYSLITRLREFLSMRLPGYMIPSYFTFLEKIPLTSNGKIDRKVLSGYKTMTGNPEYSPPRDEVEKKLAKIWTEVLRIKEKPVGIDANFFESGGHSLSATVMLSRIHKELHMKIPLARVFKTPTIKGMAQFLRESARDHYYASIEPVEKREYYQLSSPQKRLYVIQQLDPEITTYNILARFTLEGILEKRKLENCLEKLIKRHDSLRTSFEIINNQVVQIICDKVRFAIEYFDVAAGERVEQTGEKTGIHHVMSGFIRPYDLSQAPLFRVGLIKTKEDEHILMADMHHTISDGISNEILINDVVNLYFGETLPGLRLQYKDFSQWHNQLIRSGEMKKQEDYWLNLLEKPPDLELPIDFPRSETRTYEGSSVGVRLSPEQTGKLRELAKKEGTTMYMVMLTILDILLYKVTDREDIIIGTVIAGRRHADLQSIIGFFVNTLTLRNYPHRDKTFYRFFAEVKENTLAAYENQDYQFEDLVEKAALEREPGRNPLFDVMFTYISQNPGTPANYPPSAGQTSGNPSGIKAKPFTFAQGTDIQVKFDLVFLVEDIGNGIYFAIQYSTQLFKKETIEKFMEIFKTILSAVEENEFIKIGDINVSYDLRTAAADIYESDEFEF